MASTFTWLDYSEHERRKMLDVIELFGERTTRDELGLGGVRDAFAELLFPGTSTIQTRAKYFLFIPWVYLLLEQKRTSSAAVATRARKLETELMQAIEPSDDASGLIGRRARENVRRLASNVYWQGLSVWGIRMFSGSQDEYHRSLDVFYLRRQARRASRHEFDGEDVGQPEFHNWHVGLPPAPDDFPEVASFTLEQHEGQYLRERVVTNRPLSMLAYLLRERIAVDDVAYAWDLASAVPEVLREQLGHGRNFSEVMLGAQLLYNLMLAERRGWQEKLDAYRGELAGWRNLIAERWDNLQAWDRRRFWHIVYTVNPRVSSRARSFINQWVDLVLKSPGRGDVQDDATARQLVEHRETQLKGGLARLRNERALELWNGAAGAAQLDLRWGSAQQIIADVLRGLEGNRHA